ncbi:5-oxoprolinase subunit B family protein [Actinospica robiniae]|uniref:5-oxoprolinase subunit B family protein n=1 Tax=Actinospica robiniae TaxID=304901 RepID=UPI0003FF2D13|nr:allophanate hydrolase subunit 1 [Actinospica robiniae]
MRFLTAGSRALLVELDPDTDPAPVRLYRALAGQPPPGALEFVPAARTVLVRYDPAHTTPDNLADRITRHTGELRDEAPDAASDAVEGAVQQAGAVLEIPVTYDGEDLDEVARATGLSTTEVTSLHRDALYTVAFCGFAPGFGYLTGLPDALRLPRRPSPRTRVPAGSLAIADRYTAVYPHPSPGGWHLLGHTATAVWDAGRRPPALLTPGTRVRFT